MLGPSSVSFLIKIPLFPCRRPTPKTKNDKRMTRFMAAFVCCVCVCAYVQLAPDLFPIPVFVSFPEPIAALLANLLVRDGSSPNAC